ncbi:polysaccharide biosynthesis protein [Chamaesiphon sp.]|uniref:polysaccharide biosynthesis protein n=1 Tax=Chamaesiphon sp. TaxID=2814140 RepID=UPI003593FD44
MVLSKILSRSELLELIGETVPVGTPDPTDPLILARLSALTDELIDKSGRQALGSDPFSDVYDRQIVIDRVQIASILKNKVVLITGGCGFVGTNLIAKLQQFGVKRIVAVDISTGSSQPVKIDPIATTNIHIPVAYYCSDVRNLHSSVAEHPLPSRVADADLSTAFYSSVQPSSPPMASQKSLTHIFAIERPQIVFHLAAERLPGLAELQIHQTVSTNILGCDNIIHLCEKFAVESCIFSSTGKASRYFTPDIYAASKKISEWLFSDNSRSRTCQYGIVRFTHVVENSPVSADLDARVADGLVSLHAPDRYIYTQNIRESVNLLLDALTIVKPGRTKLIAVRDIGWPINTLDLALHKILKSGKKIPLYFKGLPAGYETQVFLGQLDLSGEREVLPMLNVLEADGSEISPTGDVVISEIIPFDAEVLQQSIANIRAAIGSNDLTLKQTVIDSEKAIALSSFGGANPLRLLDILKWGVNVEQKSTVGAELSGDPEIVALLQKGVEIARSAETVKLGRALLTSAIMPAPISPSADRNLSDLLPLHKHRRTGTNQRKCKKDLDPVTGDLG